MFKDTKAFSSFSVNDLGKARQFYADVLNLQVNESDDWLELIVAGSGRVVVYPKADHSAATFTVLNFPVDDIEKAVKQLKKLGVKFESYDQPGLKTGDDNICRGTEGPLIAWFKDPAGNILSVLEAGG